MRDTNKLRTSRSTWLNCNTLYYTTREFYSIKLICTNLYALFSHVKKAYTANQNRPRSIYQYSSMPPRLSGQTSIFGVVFFVSKSLLGIERQKKLEKFAILTRKPRSHVRILIYRTWPIAYSYFTCGSITNQRYRKGVSMPITGASHANQENRTLLLN